MSIRIALLACSPPTARRSGRHAPCALGQLRPLLSRPCSRRWQPCGATSDSEGGQASAMTLEDAYKQLNVQEGASFEQCLDAKNKLMSRYDGDQEKCLTVEQAYDKILSAQLSARLSGQLQVSSKVRFADVRQPKFTQKPKPAANNPLSQLPSGGIVSVRPPRGNELTTQAAVFGALAAWVLIQDWVQAPSVDAASVPALQLALGASAAVYFLREQKRAGLGKSLGLAAAGLVLGSLLGSLVESWLRVDIVPLGGISAPATVVGEFALAGLAAMSLLLA